MTLHDFYQFVEKHRDDFLLPGLVVVLFASGLFFVDDIWFGWVGRSSICPPPAPSCSLAESMNYVQTVSNSGVTLDEASIKARTATELGSLLEVVRTRPALAPYSQDLNAALTKVKDQIASAVAADAKVYTLLQKKTVSAYEADYVTHRIRLALVEQMEQYIQKSIQTESTALEKSLAEVLPENATSLELSRLLEDRSVQYLTPGELFIIEKVQIEGTRSDGNVFDTVSFQITVQATTNALGKFLADINASGALAQEGLTKPLPLMRLTQMTLSTLGSTSPDTSIDTPRPVYRGDIRLETYIRALTKESLQPLGQEVNQLRDKAKNLQATALLRPGADNQKILQLFDLANNSERLLEAAVNKNDARAMKEQMETLKELYQTIISNFNAS